MYRENLHMQINLLHSNYTRRHNLLRIFQREKSKGLGGQNTHKKLSPEPLSLYLAYNMPPRLLYLTPPLCHPILALCPPLWRCTLCQDNNPIQQGSDNKNGRRTEVFFSLKPTVIPIFLPITDSTSYNIVLLFHYRFFLRIFNLTTFLFNTPSFSFSFWFVFSSFLGFFQTASFTFLSLCIFVSISHLPLEILCLVQYRKALNKGK
jgi:hypothetical protein